jgi:pantoate--beta-alanine ligase
VADVIVTHTIAECRAARAQLGRVAFVPTMGALHAGHMSLVETGRQHAPHVAVSIFVNPTQFGPREDFTKYPRPVFEDLQKLEEANVDLVFNPAPEEMYRPGVPDVPIDVPQLTTMLEGKHRPGHFKGVCQVVAKLFNIVKPDVALFGRKDFQQLRVLQAMVDGLDFPIDVIGCTTLRDADGLAMSSRNQYLSPVDRERALSISRALRLAEAEFTNGARQPQRLLSLMKRTLLEKHLQIDYVACVDAVTLKDLLENISAPTVIAIAARVGNTRLIDNVTLTP